MEGIKSERADGHLSDSQPRSGFATMEQIDNSDFVKLLPQHVDPHDEFGTNKCKVENRTRGSFNHCAILSLGRKGRYAIKVSYRGTKEIWTDGDAFNLRSGVFTAKYIRQKTNIPIPKIHAWESSLKNIIGAPFVIMDCVPGKPAWAIWGDQEYDIPFDERERLRCKFLRNLANVMAELQEFSFDRIGMLQFEKDLEDEDAPPPTVGHRFNLLNNMMEEFPPYFSLKDYVQAHIED
jgi:hypothetical protein